MRYLTGFEAFLKEFSGGLFAFVPKAFAYGIIATIAMYLFGIGENQSLFNTHYRSDNVQNAFIYLTIFYVYSAFVLKIASEILILSMNFILMNIAIDGFDDYEEV